MWSLLIKHLYQRGTWQGFYLKLDLHRFFKELRCDCTLSSKNRHHSRLNIWHNWKGFIWLFEEKENLYFELLKLLLLNSDSETWNNILRDSQLLPRCAWAHLTATIVRGIANAYNRATYVTCYSSWALVNYHSLIAWCLLSSTILNFELPMTGSVTWHSQMICDNHQSSWRKTCVPSDSSLTL